MEPDRPAVRPAVRPALPVLVAAGAGVGAGLVHAAAAGTHGDQWELVRLFTATAVVQCALAVGVLLGRSRSWLVAAVAANAAAVGAWLLSRTRGIPAIDALAEREAVGTQDLLAAGLGAVAAVAATAALVLARREPARLPRWLPAATMVVLAVPAFAGVAAPHAHEGGDDHAHDEVATGHDHHSDGDAGALAADVRLAGADTSTASDDQLTAALDLLESTRAGESVQLTTVEEAVAAGYVWIGDGRRVGGFQHYVNGAMLGDGEILDPDAVESLVFENTASGPVLVSAMYLLEPPATMADVPDVAGDLTVWHDHQNLCWDPSSLQLAGVLVNGVCVPGGVQRGTTPMLHVWVTEHPCGPFAGIEGHGDGCAGHEH